MFVGMNCFLSTILTGIFLFSSVPAFSAPLLIKDIKKVKKIDYNDGVLYAIDVKNKLSLLRKNAQGNFEVSQLALNDYLINLGVYKDTVIITGLDLSSRHATVTFIKISDFFAPKVISKLNWEGGFPSTSMLLKDEHAYVCDLKTKSIKIINLKNVFKPLIVGEFPLSTSASSYPYCELNDLGDSSFHAVYGHGTGDIISTKDPANLSLIQHIGLGLTIEKSGDYFFRADYDTSFSVWTRESYNDDRLIKLLSVNHIGSGGLLFPFIVGENLLISTEDDKLLHYDISSPLNPTFRGVLLEDYTILAEGLKFTEGNNAYFITEFWDNEGGYLYFLDLNL